MKNYKMERLIPDNVFTEEEVASTKRADYKCELCSKSITFDLFVPGKSQCKKCVEGKRMLTRTIKVSDATLELVTTVKSDFNMSSNDETISTLIRRQAYVLYKDRSITAARTASKSVPNNDDTV